MRIMIIDDHEISRAAFRALLRSQGADVVADHRACAHALAAASALRPEVVLVDVTPEADTGLSIARKLRGLPTPPIVILTSSADPAHFEDQRLPVHRQSRHQYCSHRQPRQHAGPGRTES